MYGGIIFTKSRQAAGKAGVPVPTASTEWFLRAAPGLWASALPLTCPWQATPVGTFLSLNESCAILLGRIAAAHPPVFLSVRQSCPLFLLRLKCGRPASTEGFSRPWPQQVLAPPCLKMRLLACISVRQNSHCIRPTSRLLQCYATPSAMLPPPTYRSSELSLPDLILPTQKYPECSHPGRLGKCLQNG